MFFLQATCSAVRLESREDEPPWQCEDEPKPESEPDAEDLDDHDGLRLRPDSTLLRDDAVDEPPGRCRVVGSHPPTPFLHSSPLPLRFNRPGLLDWEGKWLAEWADACEGFFFSFVNLGGYMACPTSTLFCILGWSVLS